MTGYSVEIVESSKELTARERVALKDISNAVQLDDAVKANGSITFKPDFYAVLDVHNEHSKAEKEYKKYIIADDIGTKYVTGSESFWSAFKDIVDEMDGSGEEYEVTAYGLPSKNYSGNFLTCSIV